MWAPIHPMRDCTLSYVVVSPAVIDRASAWTRGYGCGSCPYSSSVPGESVCSLASDRSWAGVGAFTCDSTV